MSDLYSICCGVSVRMSVNSRDDGGVGSLYLMLSGFEGEVCTTGNSANGMGGVFFRI